jgi:hypothetical protein
VSRPIEYSGTMALTMTANRASPRPVGSRRTPTYSHTRMTKNTSVNLKPMAPLSPHASITSRASGLSSRPCRSRIFHVSITSRAEKNTSHTYALGKSTCGRPPKRESGEAGDGSCCGIPRF